MISNIDKDKHIEPSRLEVLYHTIKKHEPWLFLVVLTLYALISFFTLMAFPLVHSDEIWLKGIAQNAIQYKSIWITESFFDLYPRVGHPFRWLYVLTQGLSMRLLGDTLFSMRFLSLFFGILSAMIFFKLLRKLGYPALIGSLIYLFNINFIYSTHMGRQETGILFIMMLALYVTLLYPASPLIKSAFLPALILWVGIGIHPNSFIVAVNITTIMLYQVLTHKRTILSFIIFAMGLAGGFMGLVIISNLNHPGFFIDYLSYGASLGLDHEPGRRLSLFFWYFIKLFNQIGGTYDLMNIRFYLITSLALILLGKPNRIEFWGLISILLGFLLLGRNNSLAIVICLPWMILLLISRLEQLSNIKVQSHFWIVLVVFLILTLVNTYQNVQEYYSQKPYQVSYASMIQKIDQAIPDDAIVLGNLNTAEAIPQDQFYDIRNLGFLGDHNLSLEQYIDDRQITYVIIHEEMDYIGTTSPTWDFLYVNTDYFSALDTFLNTQCTEVLTFENPLYAMRIAEYSGTYPWKTTIYRVTP